MRQWPKPQVGCRVIGGNSRPDSEMRVVNSKCVNAASCGDGANISSYCKDDISITELKAQGRSPRFSEGETSGNDRDR